jgi:hypothetical protein
VRDTGDDPSHLLAQANQRIDQQNEFMARMYKFLKDGEKETETRTKRRDEHEAKRQEDLVGIIDPQEILEIKRAHNLERRLEREADKQADDLLEATLESAPKRRKGNRSLPFSRPFPSYQGYSPPPPKDLPAIQATGEKAKARESQRLARNSLVNSMVEKHKAIGEEISILEKRRAARWREMVENNNWTHHEEDPEVQALNRLIEEKSAQRLKVWTNLRERNRMAEAEREPSLSDQASSEDGIVDGQSRRSQNLLVEPDESEIVFTIKVKKGEDQFQVRFVSDESDTSWEGPLDLNTSVREILSHIEDFHNRGAQRYMGFSRAFSGENSRGVKKVSLSELIESEKRNQARTSSSVGKPILNRSLIPKYDLGDRVYYFTEEIGNEKWHSGRIVGIKHPEKWTADKDRKRAAENEIRYQVRPDRENGQEYDTVDRKESDLRSWSWAKPCFVTKDRPAPLVPLNLVGIDTCSALSVSSRREDFLWLETTKRAKKSVILRGVGGDSAKIGGRGPMVVKGSDTEGNKVLLYDPKGVYLESDGEQADFRIFGQQRLKSLRYNLVQRADVDGGDCLIYQNGKTKVPLITNDGILAMETFPLMLSEEQMQRIVSTIDSVLRGEDGMDYCIQVRSSLLMNEAYLTDAEAERLMHWRIAHRSLTRSKLNEHCPVCVEGKNKTGHFKRNYEFAGSTRGEADHYWRLYVDGYGGQNSMGDLSYQGGIGGFVFACPKGSIKMKLYGSTAQFPSIMFQVLQEIESEGYVTREIYVDTHSVNLSKAAEEIAAMFRVGIIPVSAGTPQVMAYAESAVRVIGQMGRLEKRGARTPVVQC